MRATAKGTGALTGTGVRILKAPQARQAEGMCTALDELDQGFRITAALAAHP